MRAKDFVTVRGFGGELEVASSKRLEALTEADFLKEYAWVVLASGMRESVVRDKFAAISECFLNWESADKISYFGNYCIESAMQIFNHPRKLRAIVKAADIVKGLSIITVRALLRTSPDQMSKCFPFIGPITVRHLEKLVGLDVVKEDRHMDRISKALGFPNATQMCLRIARDTGDALVMIDSVLWRFATLEPNYERMFKGFTVGRR